MGPYKPLRTWVEFPILYGNVMGVDRPDRTSEESIRVLACGLGGISPFRNSGVKPIDSGQATIKPKVSESENGLDDCKVSKL